jgi:hypothetical protein
MRWAYDPYFLYLTGEYVLGPPGKRERVPLFCYNQLARTVDVATISARAATRVTTTRTDPSKTGQSFLFPCRHVALNPSISHVCW